MIKREEGEVMFNPVFINYGCNKVQMIEHLRSTSRVVWCSSVDHSFYLLNNAFATDIAHHELSYENELSLAPIIVSSIFKEHREKRQWVDCAIRFWMV